MGTRRCAVLGSPIAHSLSPVLHHAAYDALGLDWRYDAQQVDAAGLPAFLDSLDDTWRGLSLTMPLKRIVLPLVHETSDRVQLAGVANTVLLQDGTRRAENTDIPGAVAAVRERTDLTVRRAVVLGGGATATSTLLALVELGCREVTLLVRDPARAEEAAQAARRCPEPPTVRLRRLDEPVPEADVVVSTVPFEAQSSPLVRALSEVPVVFDVIYHPWPTPLAAATAAHGQVLVGGLDLLVHQAALQVELMTGLPAPLAAMRAAGERALG